MSGEGELWPGQGWGETDTLQGQQTGDTPEEPSSAEALHWDLDRLELDFKTVAELQKLLNNNTINTLDEQLFRETGSLDIQLRRVNMDITFS